MTNTCKYCGGLIDQSASFCDSRCEDLFSKYTPTCKQCAAKDAENKELKKVISEYQHHAITDPTNQKAEIDRLRGLIEETVKSCAMQIAMVFNPESTDSFFETAGKNAWDEYKKQNNLL